MVSADVAQAITIGACQPACPDLSKHSSDAEELSNSSAKDCAVRLRDALSAMTEMRRQHDQTTQVLQFVAAALEKQGSTCRRAKHPACPVPAQLERDTQLGWADEEGGVRHRPSHALCPLTARPAEDTQAACPTVFVTSADGEAACMTSMFREENTAAPREEETPQALAHNGRKEFVKAGDHSSPSPQEGTLTNKLPEELQRNRRASTGSDVSLHSPCTEVRHPPFWDAWECSGHGVGTSAFASKARRSSCCSSQETPEGWRGSLRASQATSGAPRRASANQGVWQEMRNSGRRITHMPAFKQHIRLLMQESTTFEEPAGPYRRAIRLAERLLKTQQAECVIGFVILANSICIGMETQQELTGGADPVFETLEHVFLAVYLLEVLVRLAAGGRACFWDGWFNFDLLLVLGGCTASWVIKPLHRSHNPGAANRELLSQLMVFRTCRLLRILRAVRLMKKFRLLWRLVYGLFTSFNTMCSTLSLVVLVLYTFACLGVELITMDPNLSESASPEVRRVVDTFFKDLIVTQMFLFQFVTLDSVAAVYMPLIKEKPILALYFLTVLLVVSISLMNLVMAKIVEGALDAAQHDREMERQQRKEKVKAIIPMLKRVFDRMDRDGSGNVDLHELEILGMLEVPEELEPLVMMDSMVELFEILDIDNSGTVSQDEFIEGILSMHISEVPLQQVQMLQMIRAVRDKISCIEARISKTQVPTRVSEQKVSRSVGSGTLEQEVYVVSGGSAAKVEVVNYV